MTLLTGTASSHSRPRKTTLRSSRSARGRAPSASPIPPTSRRTAPHPPATKPATPRLRFQAACGGGSGARHPWRSICAHARSGFGQQHAHKPQPHPAHQPHPPATSNQASNPRPALQAAWRRQRRACHPWRSIYARAHGALVSTEGAGCDAAVRRATIAGAAHKAGVGRPRNALHHLLLYKANSESLSSDITGRYITNHYLPVNEAAYFPNRIEVVTVFFLTGCNTLVVTLIIPCLKA